MKKLSLLAITLFISFTAFTQTLVHIPISNEQSVAPLFKNPTLIVHHYTNSFVIATCNSAIKSNMEALDTSPWKDGESYYVVYTDDSVNKELYLQSISKTSSILIDQNSYLIVKTNEAFYGQLQPAKNDGMVRIFNKEAKLPLYTIHHTAKSSTPDPYIEGLLAQVSGENITASVQHLQEYGTRNAYAPESVEAEQWIYQQFADLGLEVETMDFTMPSGSASDNVIATLTGTKYPNEYVVVGGHYDSVSSSGDAPGADDNASGTAAVIEIARILSSQELDRSIIFCAFSGEEYGLYGSAAFAKQCANQGLNIHGYFNLDMIGYLEEGGTMKSTLIYPQPAQELADFYMNICSIYLPDFIVEPGSFSGGDSDHTSFNNNGYMGIFPFENIDAYSPYIHTSNDIIGPSYNNQDQAVVFTQASLAATVAMANRILPPQNLIAIPQNGSVKLTWNAMADIDSYTIYRNNIAIAWPAENEYIDYAVENGTQYSYFVTAIYSDTQEESDPSNTVTVTPAPPIEIPFAIYFEDGYSHFQIENGWNVTAEQYFEGSYSFSESPNGQYTNNLNSTATLTYFNLEGYTSANVSFYNKYEIESNWDYMWFEASKNGSIWTELEEFTGEQNTWILKEYDLSEYLDEPFVSLRFRFESDGSVVKQGMFIDNFAVIGEKPTSGNEAISSIKPKIFPNPTQNSVNIVFGNGLTASIKVVNLSGQVVFEESFHESTSIGTISWPKGVYIIEIITADKKYAEKLIVK